MAACSGNLFTRNYFVQPDHPLRMFLSFCLSQLSFLIVDKKIPGNNRWRFSSSTGCFEEDVPRDRCKTSFTTWAWETYNGHNSESPYTSIHFCLVFICLYLILKAVTCMSMHFWYRLIQIVGCLIFQTYFKSVSNHSDTCLAFLILFQASLGGSVGNLQRIRAFLRVSVLYILHRA